MSDVTATASAARERPRSAGWWFASAGFAGVASAGAGWLCGPLLLYSAMGGLPLVVVFAAVLFGVLGVVIGGVDALITRRPGAAARAALTVVAVAAALAAAIYVDVRATGGYPTWWWMLAPLAGGTGLGASLALSRRTAPVVAGCLVLVVVGTVFIGFVQQATADNVYPSYVGSGVR